MGKSWELYTAQLLLEIVLLEQNNLRKSIMSIQGKYGAFFTIKIVLNKVITNLSELWVF